MLAKHEPYTSILFEHRVGEFGKRLTTA